MMELSLILANYVKRERNWIDFDKPLTIRDGCEVMIYFRHLEGDRPIHGAYRDETEVWKIINWTKEGKFYDKDSSDEDLDLINVKERFLVSGFLNVYRDYEKIKYYPTRISADEYAVNTTRVACIPITIGGNIGEGLEKSWSDYVLSIQKR